MVRVSGIASFGVVLFVALQGCDSEPGPAQGAGTGAAAGSGTGGNAGTGGATSAGSGGTASGGSGGTSLGEAGASGEGGASACSPRPATPVEELRARLNTCNTDSDCEPVFAGGPCWQGCFVSVATTSVDEWDAGLASIASDLCDPSCDYLPADPATCPTTRAFCSNGTCSWGCAGELDFEPLDPADPQCGNDTCAELDVMAMSLDPRIPKGERCCTESGGCGVGHPYLFGAACFERDQPGQPSDTCPDETLVAAFDSGDGFAVLAQLTGCCRPDGQCGLALGSTGETVRLPIGAGCLERSELGAALAGGCQRSNLSKERLESIPCTP